MWATLSSQRARRLSGSARRTSSSTRTARVAPSRFWWTPVSADGREAGVAGVREMAVVVFGAAQVGEHLQHLDAGPIAEPAPGVAGPHVGFEGLQHGQGGVHAARVDLLGRGQETQAHALGEARRFRELAGEEIGAPVVHDQGEGQRVHERGTLLEQRRHLARGRGGGAGRRGPLRDPQGGQEQEGAGR